MYRLLIDRDRRMLQYGVCAGMTFVHELTTDRAEAEALRARMERGSLSVTHVWDVVEDWFGLSDAEKQESRSRCDSLDGSSLL